MLSRDDEAADEDDNDNDDEEPDRTLCVIYCTEQSLDARPARDS